MESLLVNTIIGIWLIAFGAMALFPLVVDMRPGTTTRDTPVEDQVISIQPVAIRHQITPIEPLPEQPFAAAAPDSPAPVHPLHRHAA